MDEFSGRAPVRLGFFFTKIGRHAQGIPETAKGGFTEPDTGHPKRLPHNPGLSDLKGGQQEKTSLQRVKKQPSRNRIIFAKYQSQRD
jgi:hypothetical protein